MLRETMPALPPLPLSTTPAVMREKCTVVSSEVDHQLNGTGAPSS